MDGPHDANRERNGSTPDVGRRPGRIDEPAQGGPADPGSGRDGTELDGTELDDIDLDDIDLDDIDLGDVRDLDLDELDRAIAGHGPRHANGDEPTGDEPTSDGPTGDATTSDEAVRTDAERADATGDAAAARGVTPPRPDRPTDPAEPSRQPRSPGGPVLPAGAAKAPPPMVDPMTQPRPGASTWYRTDEERAKSVYRRANPWYRRLARGLVGVAFLGAAGVGLYFGARAVQAYLDRDQLPAAGADVPDIRATSFIVTSTAPAPALDGTLTMDASTQAFEYVGRATGPQAGLQVVSPDGAEVFLRQGTGPWRAVTEAETVARDVRTAVRYLADDDNADDVLPSRLRRNFVELVDEVDEGEGAARLTRYEMTFDTRGFAQEFPLQWEDFRDQAIPGVQEGQLAITIWLDTDDVLVRLRDEQTGWAWERLTYSDQPFVPIDPNDETQSPIVQVACVSDDNTVFWQTPFPSCAEAMDVARVLAVEAGVTDTIGDATTDRSIAVLCSGMEQGEGPLPASTEEAALAAALVEGGVCRGDPGVFDSGG